MLGGAFQATHLEKYDARQIESFPKGSGVKMI